MLLQFAILLVNLFIGTYATPQDSPKIVIVGAGASGIAAASRLLENGYENVILLEAEDRIGGRIYTTTLDDYVIDLGAQWIHGEKGNVAFELAYPLGLAERPTKDLPHSTLYAAPGELLDPEIANDLNTLYDTELEIASNFTNEFNGSIGEYLENKFNQYFSKHPEINETLQKQLLWQYNVYQTGLDGSDTWYDTNAEYYSDFHDSDGSTIVSWKDRGYSTIFYILMKKIPNPSEELPVLNKTVLNAEVTKVDYSNDDGKVKIITEDGTEYIADHVIMTPSLGVLKAQYETLFNPPLPSSKINSIKGLQFGAAAKVVLVFDDCWWKDAVNETAAFSFLWNDNDRKELESDPEKKWMLSVAAFIFNEYNPRMLLGWVSGEGARLADQVPDELLFNHTMYMLNKYLSQDYNISTPLAMKRSRWTTNKHFLGTYSFKGMETHKMNASNEELSQPIVKAGKPIVLFAGEATNKHHFSTVHGAIETGWREADRIRNFYDTNEKDGEAASD